MKKLNKFPGLLLCLLMTVIIILGTVSVSAAVDNKTPDLNQKGLITIRMITNKTGVFGAQLSLYQVATAYLNGDSVGFKYTDAFEGFGSSPSKIGSTQSLQRLALYAEENSIGSYDETETNADGYAWFSGLEPGMYLVVQRGGAEDFYQCDPFAVYLPTYEGGQWMFNIFSVPKTEEVKFADISVKKVWNDDRKSRPKSIKVQLLNGKSVVETVTLSDDNDWNFTWEARRKTEDWSVKEIVPRGYTAAYSNKGLKFTITNTADKITSSGTTLMQTGQLNWPVPVFAVLGILIFVAGWLMFIRGKKAGHK